MSIETLIEKIRRLRPERIAEVEDFVDFLKARDERRAFAQSPSQRSEDPLRNVWDNPDDADYDSL